MPIEITFFEERVSVEAGGDGDADDPLLLATLRVADAAEEIAGTLKDMLGAMRKHWGQ
jgi:hypothetical protein